MMLVCTVIFMMFFETVGKRSKTFDDFLRVLDIMPWLKLLYLIGEMLFPKCATFTQYLALWITTHQL